jgi:hypothetical protein
MSVGASAHCWTKLRIRMPDDDAVNMLCCFAVPINYSSWRTHLQHSTPRTGHATGEVMLGAGGHCVGAMWLQERDEVTPGEGVLGGHHDSERGGEVVLRGEEHCRGVYLSICRREVEGNTSWAGAGAAGQYISSRQGVVVISGACLVQRCISRQYVESPAKAAHLC